VLSLLCRDNTIVHINYKSQFKEGPATARRTNTGTAAGRNAAPSSRRKSTGRGKRGAAAAAAGGGGFMTAGALAATQPAGRKGRRGSRKAGSGRGRGSGGGSSGGAKKRKGRGKRQGWRTIAGQKVSCLPTVVAALLCASYMQPIKRRPGHDLHMLGICWDIRLLLQLLVQTVMRTACCVCCAGLCGRVRQAAQWRRCLQGIQRRQLLRQLANRKLAALNLSASQMDAGASVTACVPGCHLRARAYVQASTDRATVLAKYRWRNETLTYIRFAKWLILS
jgi:hypothetical protein